MAKVKEVKRGRGRPPKEEVKVSKKSKKEEKPVKKAKKVEKEVVKKRKVEDEPVKKGRGRPRKEEAKTTKKEKPVEAKRGRGRPRKDETTDVKKKSLQKLQKAPQKELQPLILKGLRTLLGLVKDKTFASRPQTQKKLWNGLQPLLRI